MAKLSVAQNKTIEEYWMNINDYRKQMKFREWELTENKTVDTNIGGGKANRISDTTANKAILLAEDERYQHLKKIVDTVEKVYSDLEREMKDFADERYFSDSAAYADWEDVAYEIGVTKPKAFRMRNQLIDLTAKKFGWL